MVAIGYSGRLDQASNKSNFQTLPYEMDKFNLLIYCSKLHAKGVEQS